MEMLPYEGHCVGEEQLGQGEDTKKYVIHSHVLKPLSLFSGMGEKTQAPVIPSQKEHGRCYKESAGRLHRESPESEKENTNAVWKGPRNFRRGVTFVFCPWH